MKYHVHPRVNKKAAKAEFAKIAELEREGIEKILNALTTHFANRVLLIGEEVVVEVNSFFIDSESDLVARIETVRLTKDTVSLGETTIGIPEKGGYRVRVYGRKPMYGNACIDVRVYLHPIMN
jgi:hypothetical protein